MKRLTFLEVLCKLNSFLSKILQRRRYLQKVSDKPPVVWANPRKLVTSWVVHRLGPLWIASTLAGSIRTPFLDMMCPRKCISSMKKAWIDLWIGFALALSLQVEDLYIYIAPIKTLELTEYCLRAYIVFCRYPRAWSISCKHASAIVLFTNCGLQVGVMVAAFVGVGIPWSKSLSNA